MYRCQLQAHRAADVKNYEHIYCNNKYKNRSEIKGNKTWCSLKKKTTIFFCLFCTLFNQKSFTHTRTHAHTREFAHKPVNLWLRVWGEILLNITQSLKYITLTRSGFIQLNSSDQSRVD